MGEQFVAWSQRGAYASVDWAGEHHDIVAVDGQGEIVEDFRIDDDADGWETLRGRLSKYPQIAVAIETRSGAVVERLLESGFAVFPVNPLAARRYRERKAPSGTKTDRLDAWSLADALRMDGHAWRQLKSDDPLTIELRLLCRDEIALIEQRTGLINQLRAALREYYPAALKAFSDWTVPAPWAFIERFPTPQQLQQAGRRQWEKFLHSHRLYHSKELYAERLEIFAAAQKFCGSAGVTNAKSMLARTLAATLHTLQKHLDEYREKIGQRFKDHPDHDLFGSLPGAGEKLAPRLLAELGDDRTRFDSHEALQCYAGTAPVSFQSGQIRKTRVRFACQKMLRNTVHHWAEHSRSRCPWAQVYYQRKREQGQTHSCALRCLGQRWLKILWKMWQTRTRYDPELHQRNQLTHGSWLIALLPTTNHSPETRAVPAM